MNIRSILLVVLAVVFGIAGGSGGEIQWDGLTWYYSKTANRLFINGDGDFEWTPEKYGQFITRIPEQDFKDAGDVVEITYIWMTDGYNDCPPDSCLTCDRCSDNITCIAGTSDMRVGLFEADGEYVDADGLDVHNTIFEGYKGYNFRFGPNIDEDIPTRWTDCAGEVHKTGMFAKKPQGSDNLMTINEGLMDYIPGFGLAPGEYSLFTVRIERKSRREVELSITLNGKTYTDTDSSSGQPQKIDVLAVHMRNGRKYTRLVLRSTKPQPAEADFNKDCIVDGKDLRELTGDWLKEGSYEGGTPPNENNLKVHYPLDETSGSAANDASGNNNHGVVTDHTWAVPGANANTGGAVHVGENGGLTGYAPGISGDFTLALWMNPEHSNYDRMVSFGDVTHVLHFSREVGVWELVWNGGDPLAGGGGLQSGWHHLAFVVTGGSNMHIYYDGGSFWQGGVGDVVPIHEFHVTYSPQHAEPLAADIDDVRVYDCALTADEVLYLASGASPVLVPPDSPANLYFDHVIDFEDFAKLASYWLQGCK